MRNTGRRHIRYANGDEGLYDETKDTNDYVNLATKPEFTAKKAELAKFLPKTDVLDPSGNVPVKEDAAAKAAKKAKRQSQKN